MYGRVGRGPLDVLKDNWSNDGSETVMLDRSFSNYLDRLKCDRLKCDLCKDAADVQCGKMQRAYVEQYNLRFTPRSFEKGDQVIVIIPGSTNKMKAKWHTPAVVHFKRSKDSYMIAMPDGAVRCLHANMLRAYNVPVYGIGILFEDDSEGFGDIVCCGSRLNQEQEEETSLTWKKLEEGDFSLLTEEQQSELKNLIWS